jgi:hypothetical protein
MGKLILLACLTLAVGKVYAAASLEVDISVSINSTVTIEWADNPGDTANRTWTIGAVNLSAVNDTLGLAGAGNTFGVKNTSQVPVIVTVGCTNQGAWQNKSTTFASLINQFRIKLSTDHATFPVTLPDGTAATTTLIASLQHNTSSTVDLQFQAPATVSTGTNGGIAVTMVAAAL